VITVVPSASRQATKVAWTNAILNVLLTFGKGAIGLATGSRALVADAIHSAADVVGSIAVIVGLRIASKPADDDHPYGHGKAELISSAMVATFLILAGFDVAYTSIKSLFTEPASPHAVSAYTAAAAIILKEFMFQYNWKLGKKLGSRSLIASAYDHRSDVFSSAAALIGILLSLLGHWQHIYWLLYMDTAASGFVAVLIVRVGYKVAIDSLQPLMDKAVEPADMEIFHEVTMQVPGVAHIDAMRARDHGHYVIVDVEISVDASMSVAAGHEIATDVKKELVARVPRVSDVFVHVNPHYPLQRRGAPNHD